MQIRTKLTLIFIFIVAFTIFISSAIIYFFSADYRSSNFFERLQNKAYSFAQITINEDGFDQNRISVLENSSPYILPKEHIFIYNDSGQVIYSSFVDEKINIPQSFIIELKSEGVLKTTLNGFEVYGFRYDKYNQSYFIITAAIDRFGKSKLQNLALIILFNFSFIIIFIAIAGWIFAGRILAPITTIINQVETITENNLNERLLEPNNKDEITKLIRTFNSLLERLQIAFMLQKSFVTNASHELRTPLTVISGQLEVLLLKDREKNEYVRTINSVLEDIKNLNIISNRLLLLAQSHISKSDLDFQKIRIDDLLWLIQSEIIKFHPQYLVNISFTDMPESEEDLTIEGNQHLLKTALINLIENGCKFSDDRTVIVELKFDHQNIQISFTDQGIGIQEDDLLQIFEPFFRSKNAISIPGHGLGLALTQKIIHLHQGNIEVKSKLGKFTSILISLPKRQNI